MRRVGVAVTALLACACCAVLWAACASFSGDAATGDDAGEAGTEAASDAPAVDSPIGDAPFVEAGVLGCTPGAHTFCDDFEKDPLTSGLWTLNTIAFPGALAQSTERAHSGTHSVLVTVAPDAGSNGNAYVARSFTASVRSISCEFWFYGETLTPGGSDQAAIINYEVSKSASSPFGQLVTRLYVAADSATLVVLETDPDGGVVKSSGPPLPHLPQGRWAQVQLEMGMNGSSVGLRVDGAPAYGTTFPISALENGGFTLALGVFDTAKESRFFIDDISCDIAP